MPKTLDRILEEENGKSWSDYKRAEEALERHDARTKEMRWYERAWTHFERQTERRELDQELNYFYGRSQMAHELNSVIREGIDRTWAADNTKEPTRALTLDKYHQAQREIDRETDPDRRAMVAENRFRAFEPRMPTIERDMEQRREIERIRERAERGRNRDDFDLER